MKDAPITGVFAYILDMLYEQFELQSLVWILQNFKGIMAECLWHRKCSALPKQKATGFGKEPVELFYGSWFRQERAASAKCIKRSAFDGQNAEYW